MSLKRTGISVAIGLVVLAIGLIFFNKKTLDSDDAAQKIEQGTVSGTSVTCEDDVEIDPGTEFTCTATLDGEDYEIPAEVVSDEPTFTYGPIPRPIAAAGSSASQ